MTEVNRETLQSLVRVGRGDVADAVRSVRGSVIVAAASGQRWWREQVFDVGEPHCRNAVTTATVGAVQEALFAAFPDVTVRYIFETHDGRMRRLLELDWS